MKKRVRFVLSVIMMYFLGLAVSAETLTLPQLYEYAPYTSDQINLIIMMLCISGGGLILLLLFTIIQKYKKK